jgi:phosphatidylethanolamine-binding protein (PEBP) family uncharacterized protein
MKQTMRSSLISAFVVLAALLVAGCASTSEQVSPTAFRLTSPGLPDNGILSRKNAGNNKANPNCLGENVSPPLAWFNAPPKTRSFAILMDDQAGQSGLGVSHWVAYGIPANVTGFAEGEASAPSSSKFVGGRNIYGWGHYAGPVRRGAMPINISCSRSSQPI